MSSKEQVFRVQGMSCANCAKTFENNIKRLKAVEQAKVNFAASKVSVLGEATVKDIEKAGAFENIKVIHEDGFDVDQQEPFLLRHFRLVFASMLITAAFIFIHWTGISKIATTLLLAAAILIGGINLFRAGIVNLTRLRFDMKTLMTIAVIGAAIIGEWQEAAIVVILFAISEALEAYSMDKARQSIQALMGIAPKQALIKRHGTEQLMDIADIQIGDIMLVKPGEKLAMDGVVMHGVSAINQAPITGESIPVEKNPDDTVFAGTMNQDGFLEIKVTKLAKDTTIAKIIHLVEEAQAERAPSQAFVDRFAAYYTPIIMVIALLTAIIPSLLTGNWSTWVYQGLAILVVGCPCALVISTPVAIVTAIGTAARNGVLIKGGIYLEEIGHIHSIAFDKTGTLTMGEPHVTDTVYFTDDPAQAFSMLAALENKSQHPLAKAILAHAETNHIPYKRVQVDHFSSLQGKGIHGMMNGEIIYAGSPKLFAELGLQKQLDEIATSISAFQAAGKTIMLLGTATEILLAVALRDEPRKESKAVISRLHQLGLKHSFMLTGDHPETAHALTDELAITDVKAGLMPAEKMDFIKQYEQRNGPIAMVGDGINDTPALAAATVGIAMGTAGTDSALETADVALMGDDLKKLPFTVQLSRRALTIIKQNIAFAIGMKLIALLLVIPGWLTLWIAIFSDMGATLLVTLNALRLLRKKGI